MTYKIEVDEQEFQTILAALSHYWITHQGTPQNRTDYIHGIATKHDEVTSLDGCGVADLYAKVRWDSIKSVV